MTVAIAELDDLAREKRGRRQARSAQPMAKRLGLQCWLRIVNALSSTLRSAGEVPAGFTNGFYGD